MSDDHHHIPEEPYYLAGPELNVPAITVTNSGLNWPGWQQDVKRWEEQRPQTVVFSASGMQVMQDSQP
jgi:hypothetical protein